MKKWILLLLVTALVVTSLAGCGKKEPDSGSSTPTIESSETSSKGDSSPEETEYVEELPAKNELNPSQPIPADTGTLELHEYDSPLAFVKMMLPDGVTVQEGDVDSYGNGHVYVYDDNGEWVIEFRPMHASMENLPGTLDSLNSNPQQDNGTDSKVDWSKDIDGTFAGFPAKFWANNIRGYIAESNDNGRPAVVIWMDYGEVISGPWYSLMVRLEAQNPVRDETNIYELLYRRAVRAILNNFSVIETTEGITYESNGFAVTMPSRFNVIGDGLIVATIRSGEYNGSLIFCTDPGSDPEAAAASKGDNTFTKSFGGKTWYGSYQVTERQDENGDPLDPDVMVYLYTDYSEKRIQRATIKFQGFSIEDYEAYMNGDQYSGIMTSLQQNPSSWQDPTLVSADGFTASFDGTLQSYTGSGGAIEIPAEIGDVAITAVGGFQGNTAITSVIIPEGVTYIRSDAFKDCTNLTSVVIPASVTTIGINAFSGCTSLKTADISTGVISIEGHAFDGCSALTDVVIPDTVVSIGAWTFGDAGQGSFTGPGAVYGYDCFSGSTFSSITIGADADISANWMFYNCKASEIILGDGITTIGTNAFFACENLASLHLPDSVTTLGEGAFANVHISGDFEVNLPAGIDILPKQLFIGTSMEVLFIPVSVTRIETEAVWADLVYLMNPNVELAENALFCDRVYLNEVYSPDQAPSGFENQAKDFSGVQLPPDASMAETVAFDNYLTTVNQGEVTWYGIAPQFYPEDPEQYVQSGHYVTGYTGTSDKLYLPPFATDRYNNIWWVQEGAFAGNTTITEVNFGLAGELFPNILNGCDNLKDIWIGGELMDNLVNDPDTYIHENAFAGTPEGITVHLPASWSEAELAAAQESLLKAGLSSSTNFVTYSLR